MASQKILIVDDDPDMRRGLDLRLRSNGFETVFAQDGVSAISMARQERPDLVLLDLGLPAGNGFTVLQRLRALPWFGATPIVVLSAREAALNRERARKAGAAGFFQKPADNAELLDGLRRALAGEELWAAQEV